MAEKITLKTFWDEDEALNYLMLDLFKEIGNGDNENGGMGSLWRCSKEIYDTLKDGYSYSYADCDWKLEEGEDGIFIAKIIKKKNLKNLSPSNLLRELAEAILEHEASCEELDKLEHDKWMIDNKERFEHRKDELDEKKYQAWLWLREVLRQATGDCNLWEE